MKRKILFPIAKIAGIEKNSSRRIDQECLTKK